LWVGEIESALALGEDPSTDVSPFLYEPLLTVNRNTIPFDPHPPMNPSGSRYRDAGLDHARARRGGHARDRAHKYNSGALGEGFESERGALLERSRVFMERYPLYPRLGALR
jgi:hypothetical protein